MAKTPGRLAVAYVLHRERVIGPAAAALVGLLPPAIGGLAKIIEEKHWPSEVAGGLLVALVIASLSVPVYELERAEQPESSQRTRAEGDGSAGRDRSAQADRRRDCEAYGGTSAPGGAVVVAAETRRRLGGRRRGMPGCLSSAPPVSSPVRRISSHKRTSSSLSCAAGTEGRFS